MEHEHRSSYIDANSVRVDAVQKLQLGEFDLAVFASSWDSRSICVVEAPGIRAAHGVVLLLEKRDTNRLRDRHDAELQQLSKDRCGPTQEIKGASTDV